MSSEEKHRSLEVNGIKLHLVEVGPAVGEPVLLLHGFPEFWWGWRNQLPALADAGFRVVAVDMRGYGCSGCPQDVASYQLGTLVADVMKLADALGWQRFNLVGHDWGGIVAWAVAAHHPLRRQASGSECTSSRRAVDSHPQEAVAASAQFLHRLLSAPDPAGEIVVRRAIQAASKDDDLQFPAWNLR